MKSKVIIFVSLLFVAYYANSAPKTPIYKGQLLSEAKAKLVAKGWKPYRVMGDKTPPNEISGMAKNYMNAGYLEVGNCGASNPDCDFHYRKKNMCLKIIAGSYEAPVNETTVTEWTNECERVWWN